MCDEFVIFSEDEECDGFVACAFDGFCYGFFVDGCFWFECDGDEL